MPIKLLLSRSLVCQHIQPRMKKAHWNMLLTKKYGSKFAYDFTTAHERGSANTDTQEAMDLYNNELGRLVGLNFKREEHGISDAEYLGNLIDSGRALTIGQDHKLRRSNTVERGHQYDPAGAAKERPGVSPILVPCSMSVRGNCADR